MKKLIIASFALLSLATSCQKKSEVTPAPVTATSVYGQWRWIATYYDGAPGPNNPTTPANTGATETVTFNNYGSWNDQINGAEAASGTFSVNSASGMVNFSGGSTNSFVVGHPYYSISGDTISFFSAPGVYGGGSSQYVKVQ